MYYRTIYTIEFGYYKNVEYFVRTLQVLSIVLIILFILRKTRFKFSHILLFLDRFDRAYINFTSLTKDNLISRPSYDLKIVKARNLHYRLSSYIMNTGIDGVVDTNYPPLCRLIPPGGIKFRYTHSSIDSISFTQGKPSYLLLEDKKLTLKNKKYIKKEISDKNFIVKFEDGMFILLKVTT